MAAKEKLLSKDLQFEKKNKDLVRLPKYARVQKRPIPHPPVASPYAGSSVPKVIYVGTNTPFMSVVKRVQKMLRHAEKRATAGVDLGNNKISEKEKLARLAKGQETLRKEEVFIKATGRAIERALSVGRWFEEKEEEYEVRVKTGTVLVVDDIVEDEEAKRKEMEKEKIGEESGGDGKKDGTAIGEDATRPAESEAAAPSKQPSKKRKRRAKAAVSGDVELPESRTRWVNMVEIAITLK
ncbi:hypothetical protein DTO166G4_7453 [Paecilomyces variotii]|nr:hypothetical protein DTO166G4_7453 [Paecilomyces variotii]KAJ9242359.1 hypothetical protein DTO166G5_762 [Paecilomyces variotii]KAJ9353138.1 hypothetical protein DTO027B9_5390 [Paecilomyces variotii]